MAYHAVTLGVKPCLRIECKFWLGDDCWNAICEQSEIAVQAGTFEEAKSDMELALGKYIESLLRQGVRRPSWTSEISAITMQPGARCPDNEVMAILSRTG